MRSGRFTASVPKLWAMGGLAVFSMAAVTFSGLSTIIAHAGFFAKGAPQNTYFVVPHIGVVVWQAAALVVVFGVFAGWYHFFPKITGWSYSERLGRIHFWMSIGAVVSLDLMQIIIWAQLFLFAPDAAMLRYWRMITPISVLLLAAGLLVFFANMVLSCVRGQPAR